MDMVRYATSSTALLTTTICEGLTGKEVSYYQDWMGDQYFGFRVSSYRTDIFFHFITPGKEVGRQRKQTKNNKYAQLPYSLHLTNRFQVIDSSYSSCNVIFKFLVRQGMTSLLPLDDRYRSRPEEKTLRSFQDLCSVSLRSGDELLQSKNPIPHLSCLPEFAQRGRDN